MEKGYFLKVDAIQFYTKDSHHPTDREKKAISRIQRKEDFKVEFDKAVEKLKEGNDEKL